MSYRVIILLYLKSISFVLSGQTIGNLTDYLTLLQVEGYESEMAQYQKAMATADYEAFKRGLYPQIRLNAALPQYTRTSSSVVQPNGSIAFQPVYQNIAMISVFAEQAITLTGGTLFFESGLDRFDDFSRKFTLFNGIPIRIGYRQSLVGFNPWKWEKKIAEERKQVADYQYIFELETAKINGINAYFDVLIASTNLRIASSNLTVNEKLLEITNERLSLGKISRDDQLQMEAEYHQARLLQTQSITEQMQARLRMVNLLKAEYRIEDSLHTPVVKPVILPDEAYLIALAINNHPILKERHLVILDQQRNEARLKSELGPQFQVFTALGLAQSGSQVAEIYAQPFNEQQIQASVSVPIVDWGRRKSATQAVRQRIAFEQTNLEYQKEIISSQVKERILEIRELGSRLSILNNLAQIAEDRYQISTERYIAGAIPNTELVFAQRNKDQSLREYLFALRAYYLACHDLQRWTGYPIFLEKE